MALAFAIMRAEDGHEDAAGYHPGWVLLPGYYRFIASLDLAAFVGSINWLILDRRHPTGMRRSHGAQ